MFQIDMKSGLSVPNFFILGAARCGTTSLHNYLNSHPDVFLTREKEPTFFIEGNNRFVSDPVTYSELFAGVTSERIVGESSHAYMSNPKTPKLIRCLFPDAKFVVIMRDPVDRAFSLYHWMRRNGYEFANSFEKGLDLEEERFNSEDFRRNNPQYFYNYMYFRSGLYGEQISRYLSLFPREQFFLIRAEEFFLRPKDCISEVFRFLDVDDTFMPVFKRYNAGDWTQRLPGLLYAINQSAFVKPRSLRRYLHRLIYRHGRVDVGTVSDGTRKSLGERFAEDQKLLKEISGIHFPVS